MSTQTADTSKDDKETFSGRFEDFKGRMKEATGVLFDDEDTRREGKLDQHTAAVRDKVNGVIDSANNKIKDLLDGKDDEQAS